MPIRVHTDAAPAGSPVRGQLRRRPPETGGTIAEHLFESVRRVLFAFGRSAPPTAVDGAACLILAGRPATTTAGVVSIGNQQAAASVVVPVLSVLRGPAGARWAPVHRLVVGQRLLLAGDRTDVELTVAIDPSLPPGSYCGELALLGISGSIAVEVLVAEGDRP